jgi:hypothetical protein
VARILESTKYELEKVATTWKRRCFGRIAKLASHSVAIASNSEGFRAQFFGPSPLFPGTAARGTLEILARCLRAK